MGAALKVAWKFGKWVLGAVGVGAGFGLGAEMGSSSIDALAILVGLAILAALGWYVWKRGF